MDTSVFTERELQYMVMAILSTKAPITVMRNPFLGLTNLDRPSAESMLAMLNEKLNTERKHTDLFKPTKEINGIFLKLADSESPDTLMPEFAGNDSDNESSDSTIDPGSGTWAPRPRGTFPPAVPGKGAEYVKGFPVVSKGTKHNHSASTRSSDRSVSAHDDSDDISEDGDGVRKLVKKKYDGPPKRIRLV